MQHDPRCGAILCAAEEELAPFLPHLAEEQRLSRAMLPDVSLRGAKRRGALSAKREEVPLECNFGKALAVRTGC